MMSVAYQDLLPKGDTGLGTLKYSVVDSVYFTM